MSIKAEKRMISKREETILKKRSSNVGKSDACATEDQVKKPKTCKSCGEVGFHDSTNCPNKECDTSSSSCYIGLWLPLDVFPSPEPKFECFCFFSFAFCQLMSLACK
ncbi:unnamed protein product [Cuscuta epithymum]|uniref:CCHC-type domain-containing protein n=1 Tax=Cuscuta epithymum TaxID=186058 RepID=A0AAV0EPJ9_9ASTE|nr:unnamed protein product [Cuscuta epithymum]